MVAGDLDHPATLEKAFQGAHAIFAVTDFWQPYFVPANRLKVKPGQTMNEFCYDLEVQQGKNIAQAAAKVEGLERLVYSSLSDAKKWSKGKYTWVYHFDGKAKAVEYIKEELPELAKKMSVLLVSFFSSPLFPNSYYILSHGIRCRMKLTPALSHDSNLISKRKC